MIAIKNVLLSNDVVEKQFVCNLSACKGACCVEGDHGAPLEEEELKILEKNYDKIKKYITKEGRAAIEKLGLFVYGKNRKPKTPLINGGPCAYISYENGVAKCGIELAHQSKEIKFKKPLSCHLYPLLVSKRKTLEFVNYDKWEICDPACDLGKSLQVPVYQFLKEAIIRKFGKEFYSTLDKVAKHLEKKVPDAK